MTKKPCSVLVTGACGDVRGWTDMHVTEAARYRSDGGRPRKKKELPRI